MTRFALGLALLFALSSAGPAQKYATNLPVGHPAIRYFETELTDPATALAKGLERRSTELDFQAGAFGYLPSLLAHLDIHTDSQTLVFSKTSFQSAKISPHNPRAVYFNDNVTVGFVPGGEVLEVAALDPKAGVVFYTLDTQQSERPLLNRRDVCLKCHQGPATQGVPGIFVGSVFPNSMGTPSPSGAIITDHRTPFADRWGGWFLSAPVPASRVDAAASDPAEPESLSRIRKTFDAASYLSPTSDPVALMTMEHQTQMVNLFTRLGWEARMGSGPSNAEIEDVVRYMTFADEVRLPRPIEAVSTFARTFPQRGPRDSKGRSLRDFDLHGRLFRYPLSYMIYSAQFDALPVEVRGRLFRRLSEVLAGTPALEILKATKLGLR